MEDARMTHAEKQYLEDAKVRARLSTAVMSRRRQGVKTKRRPQGSGVGLAWLLAPICTLLQLANRSSASCMHLQAPVGSKHRQPTQKHQSTTALNGGTGVLTCSAETDIRTCLARAACTAAQHCVELQEIIEPVIL